MKKKIGAHLGSNAKSLVCQSSTLSTMPQETSGFISPNHYLSQAYGKESFDSWGTRPCTVPGVTELQIHRPYMLSKGSGNDPS